MATDWVNDPNALGDFGMDAVGWSKIGEAVFELSTVTSSGFAQLGVNGRVFKILKLGESVIVYSDRGVFQFYPTDQPVVGFGKKHLQTIPGIAGRDAVGGNDDLHVFIDVVANLWVFPSGGQPEKLGYQEFFKPSVFGSIVVVWNPQDNSFFLGNGEVSYRWDQYGLARVWQCVTSCGMLGSELVGLFFDVDNQGFEIITDVLDFGTRARKTITHIEVGGVFTEPVFVSVNWKNHSDRYFKTAPWRRLNPQGFAHMRFTAEEFQVKLMSQAQDAQVEYINVKVQYPDKRFTRSAQRADSTDG